MKFHTWAKTDRGLKRETNQDSFLLNDELGLYIVADGMGGHSGGEVASAMAVKEVENVVRQKSSILEARELIIEAYTRASTKIYDCASYEKTELAGMGTTMVVLFVRDQSVYIGNVGDSRAYLFRDKKLWQLTEDHSLVNEQLRAGNINDQQAKNFVGRNVITRSVGYEREVEVDVLERPLMVGDHILVCSDGLSGLVDDEEICQILSSTPEEKVVDVCIERALANGGNDNVTVLYMSYN